MGQSKATTFKIVPGGPPSTSSRLRVGDSLLFATTASTETLNGTMLGVVLFVRGAKQTLHPKSYRHALWSGRGPRRGDAKRGIQDPKRGAEAVQSSFATTYYDIRGRLSRRNTRTVPDSDIRGRFKSNRRPLRKSIGILPRNQFKVTETSLPSHSEVTLFPLSPLFSDPPLGDGDMSAQWLRELVLYVLFGLSIGYCSSCAVLLC